MCIYTYIHMHVVAIIIYVYVLYMGTLPVSSLIEYLVNLFHISLFVLFHTLACSVTSVGSFFVTVWTVAYRLSVHEF